MEDTSLPKPPIDTEINQDTKKKLLSYVIPLGTKFLYLIAAMVLFWIAAKLGVPVPVQPPAIVVEKPVTVAAMEEEKPEILYFCGRTETIRENFKTAPWPVAAREKLTWNIDTSRYVGPLSSEQVREAFEVAWNAWGQHLQLEPVYVANPQEALVRSRFGDIDGSGKVLAWSELADGTSTQKDQQYDRGESWSISSNPGRATIDMVRVACHEIGHVLGLVHDDVGTGALMEPTYSVTVRFPTSRDIERLVAMGYKIRPKTGTTPAPAIKIEVSADPNKLAELLRQNGYRVEVIPKKQP